jgi:ABC-type glycerol-3-phosphate transport system substrate-binding protein
MRSDGRVARVVAVVAVACLGIGSAFSSGKAEETATGSQNAPVKITILWPEESTANDINKYLSFNQIYDEIVRKTNVSFDVVGWSQEKINVSIAGGDMPDLVCVGDDTTRSLVTARMLHDLDPLLVSTKSPLLSYAPERLQSARDKYEGRLWYVTPRARGPEVEVLPGMTNDVYPTLRWDYYKELGYPAIKSFDDLLDVLERAVKNHPQTVNQRKVYAMGAWNDWSGGFWNYLLLTGVVEGLNNIGGPEYTVSTRDEQLMSTFMDPRSGLWSAALLMNKANRRGILHPDTFTMKYSDFEGAVVRGEIIYAPAIYPMQKANSDLVANQGTGFITIPFDFGYSYSPIGAMRRSASYRGTAGWLGKNWSITTNSRAPERVMDLLNFTFSPEGSRLIQSGIQGVHWDYVDGKPQMKPEVIQAKIANTEEWQRYALDGSKGNLSNLAGLDRPVLAADGYPVNLLSIASAYEQMLDPVQREFSSYYKVAYPFDAWVKKHQAGLLQHNPDFKGVALPSVPDDIKRINVRLEDIMLKGLPRCILEPRTDAEFNAARDRLIQEIRDAGGQTSWDWALAAFNTERAKKYN